MMINAWRTRVAVLWLAIAIGQSAALMLWLFKPGALRDLMNGTIAGVDVHSTAVQINTALYWVGSLTIAFLTLILTDRFSRWMNGIAAGGSLLNMLGGAILGGGTFGGTEVISLFMVLIVLLIVWHVWKWPTPEPRTGVDQADVAEDTHARR